MDDSFCICTVNGGLNGILAGLIASGCRLDPYADVGIDPRTGGCGGRFHASPSNIPEVRVQGFEADFAMLVSRGLTLRASLAYADGEYTDYPQGPCPLEWQNPNATGGCQPFAPPSSLANQTSNPRGNPATPGAYVLSGLPLAGLSKWVGSLGVDYSLPMGSGTWVFHGDWGLILGQPGDPRLVGLRIRSRF